MQDRENELLRQIVLINNGQLQLPATGPDIEAQLASCFMPDLQASASEAEILAWGSRFKELATHKIAQTEVEMRASGEL
jgi:hypothetical protein